MRTIGPLAGIIALSVLWLAAAPRAADLNSYGLAYHTIETAHFRINYHDGVEDVAREAAGIFEGLDSTYRTTYGLTLPQKTEIVVINDYEGNGGAYDNLNTIVISASAFDFNLRGTHDWLRLVCAHEYAHIVSISCGHKWPASLPYFQFGFFSHPNERDRVEALHIYPLDILPPWFFEGIAQYESVRHGSEQWDSHRDMILRTLTLSNKPLSWDHMNAFAGRGDDFEKVYNQGFSLVSYIADTYGYPSVVALLKESSRLFRVGFDASVRHVLGIGAGQLYRDWRRSLEVRYKKQIEGIGKQVYGRKINKDGFDNFWPRFAPDGRKIYFISNGKADYSLYRLLYSYTTVDTVKEDKRIKPEMGAVRGFYDIHKPSRHIVFSSAKSAKSTLPPKLGALRTSDIFIDTLPPDKPAFRLFKKKTERQVTEKMNMVHAVFSPAGDRLACADENRGRARLWLVDAKGKDRREVFPDTTRPEARVTMIFSLDWASDGRRIALSYLDEGDRKIGIYDTSTHAFSVLCDTPHDERDPKFSADAAWLYFSSDRTGIFNIYRYNFESHALQRVTNVSGGAFAPDVSRDNVKLVYANYDSGGYGIYLIDSVKAVEEIKPDSGLVTDRAPVIAQKSTIPLSIPRRYSYLVRKAFLIPTLFTEQAVTQDNDPFRGRSVLKAGVIFDFFDPAFLTNKTGDELRGYLLLDPRKLFSFIDIGRGLINPRVDYDFGLSATSNLPPIPVSADYAQNSITGRDYFFNELDQRVEDLDYNVTFYNTDVRASLYFNRDFESTNGVSLFAAGNLTSVTEMLDSIIGVQATPFYNTAKGYRFGAFWALSAPEPSPTMNISPHGMELKLQYDFQTQMLIDDENSFNASGQENYHFHHYHEALGDLRLGIAAPWYANHSLYFDVGAAAMQLVRKNASDHDTLPYYYEPEIWWAPGYAYYVQDTIYKPIVNDSGRVIRQTPLPYLKGVIAGNAVAHATASYRFPLWPGSINRKLWFIYLDRLFGVVNYTVAAGFAQPSRLADFRKEDWLCSRGAELRLEALTFGRYPLAIDLKWDQGLSRRAPVGGDRFTLGVGFSFDYWGYIDSPTLRPAELAAPRAR